MSLNVEQFFRKSFPVEAVRITAENMADAAEWCNGTVRSEDVSAPTGVSINFIKVRVENPLTERQTKAYVGDWVLYAGKGYKVYKANAFSNSFGRKGDAITQNVFEGESEPATSDLSSSASANPGGTRAVGG